MTLKELRKSKKLTQEKAANLLGVSLRSYKSYENDKAKLNSFNYRYLFDRLSEFNKIDEEHGVLELSDIRSIVSKVLVEYDVNFCYLFGSYAKGKATGESDVDLIIDSSVKGLQFFGLIEKLRTSLCKKIDLLQLNQLDNNQDLLRDVLKEGIKVYG